MNKTKKKQRSLFIANTLAAILHTALFILIIVRQQNQTSECDNQLNEAILCSNGSYYNKGDEIDSDCQEIFVCKDGSIVDNETQCTADNPRQKVCTNGFVLDNESTCTCKARTRVNLLRDFYVNEYRRDKCALDNYNEKCEYWPYAGTKETGECLDLNQLLLLFTGITVLAHVVYAVSSYPTLKCSFYLKNVFSGKNPLRWIEYALSAPVMLIILAVLSSVRNRNQLLLIYIATFIQMFQGWYVEDAISKRNFRATILPLFIGWLLLIFAWIGVFDSWYSNINESFDTYKECGKTEDARDAIQEAAMPPEGIVHLIFVTFALFASFGVLNVVNVLHAKFSKTYTNKNNFFQYEIGYIILSFVSKAMLIVWCIFSIFEGELSWLQVCASTDMRTCLRKILIERSDFNKGSNTS